MKKLSKENIQFIDNYLKNSGVDYLDVRLEMTDHVASEIETKMAEGDDRGFYEIFKSYMLENKTTLLKSMKKFRIQADRKVFWLVLRNLYHPKTVVSSTILTFSFFQLDFLSQNWETWISFTVIMLAVVLFLHFTFSRGQKYSALHRLIFWLGLLDYFVFSKLFQISYDNWSQICAILIIWVNISAIKTLFDLKHFYKKQFQTLWEKSPNQK